jgi:membrane-associated phospholipid phosphatase
MARLAPLPHRARLSLIVAAGAIAALVLVWFAAHWIAPVRRADVSILGGFAQLGRPRLNELTSAITSLCNPQPYVVLAAIPVLVALLRGRPRVAVCVGAIMLCANESTELLKPVLAGPRDPVPWTYLGHASFPSGHATAAMSLAMSAVIAAPARRRPTVAAVMAAFAVAVAYSFLELSWHYPSDVLGGYLMATIWTSLGVAVLTVYEQVRPARARRAGAGGAGATTSPVSVREALTPPGALLFGVALFAAIIAVMHPRAVVNYASAHEAFVVGAIAIAAVGFALASGLSLMLRRG